MLRALRIQLYERIRSGKHAPLRKDLPKDLLKLFKGLLEVNPSKRLSSADAALNKWFAPLQMTARTARAMEEDEE